MTHVLTERWRPVQFRAEVAEFKLGTAYRMLRLFWRFGPKLCYTVMYCLITSMLAYAPEEFVDDSGNPNSNSATRTAVNLIKLLGITIGSVSGLATFIHTTDLRCFSAVPTLAALEASRKIDWARLRRDEGQRTMSIPSP